MTNKILLISILLLPTISFADIRVMETVPTYPLMFSHNANSTNTSIHSSPNHGQQSAAAILEDSIEELPAEATIRPYVKFQSVSEDAIEQLPSDATVDYTVPFDNTGIAEDAM